MRKRLSSKLLALVLTLAICATTVFGCLMTVNAADSCYSFGAAVVSDDLTEATIDVTFTAPANLSNGFVAGAFSIDEVDADGADKLTIKSVGGSGISASVEGNYVVFDIDAAKSIATLQLTFGFSNGIATKGKDYKIQLSEVELAYNDSEYYVESATGAIGKISTECEHVLGVVGEPLKVDTANNYSVYENSVCTICGEKFGIQLVPTAEKLNADGAENEGTILQWDGTSTKTAPTQGSGTEADPYIISEVAHLAYIIEAGPDATYGKYYKVADGIKSIILQSAADPETLMNIDSAEEAKTYISGLATKNRWGSGKYDAASAFCGHFDGNGATVYGMGSNGSNNVSLFGSIGPVAEFKNISVKNSYIQTGWYAAGLAHVVRACTLTDGTVINLGTVKIDNCTFANNYFHPTSGVNGGTTGNQCVAVIIAQTNADVAGSGLAVNNVLAYGNITYYDQQQANISPVFGNLSSPPAATAETETAYCELMNSVLLDVTGDIFVNNNSNFKSYQNVEYLYTDSTYVAEYHASNWYNQTTDAFTVTRDSMLGKAAIATAPGLDWGKTWLLGADGELPRIAAPDYVSDTICWDGTVATGIAEGSGSDTDPFIINSVSELAYVVALGNETEGKYYKIADGIKNVVLQKYAYANDIMALDSASDVQAYFESGNIAPQQWIFKGWAANAFSGKFDGNGATIYGLYSDAVKNLNSGANHQNNSNPALFPAIDAGAEFSNIAIKNSYVYGKSGWNAGIFASIVCSGTYGNGINDGVVKFDNCAIVNNYFRYTGSDRGAIFFSSANGEVAEFSNCLVYGNDAADTEGSSVSLAIGMKNSIKDAEGNWVYATYKNSVIFGVLPYYSGTVAYSRVSEPQCYSNVYTDAPAGKDVYTNATFSEDQLKQVAVADILGSQAKNTMPNLAWGTDWYCGAYGEPPVLAPFATLGASDKSTFAHQLYGSSVTYNNDGTIDFNLHFIPQYEGIKATLYVGTADTSKFYKLTATESSYRDELGDTALMFTLPNISARDIDKVWLPTIVVEGGEKTEWGKTHPIAVIDNAKGVLAGDYDAADKQVAAALINYGTTADDALSITKNDYTEGTVDLLEFGDYLVNDLGSTSRYYDNKLADNGETGADWENAIIIDSAEEFVYLAKASGNDTIGKYYKVADGIAGFNLATDKLDINGTLTGKSLASGKTNLDIVKGSGKNHSGGTPGFQGHFDGNGATVYGAWTNHNSIPNYAGLFSCVKGNVTIKNINVKLSYLVATYAAGGIVGYHSADTKSTLTIENCSITETYIESTGVTGYGSGAGAIIGRGASAPALREANDQKDYNGDGDMVDTIYQDCPYNVTNCYVNLDPANIVSAGSDGIEESNEAVIHGGVVAFADSNAVMVSNCVVIGITPYPITDCTTSNAIQHSAHANNFSNVYTDQYVGTAVYVGGTNGSTQNLTTVMTQLTTEQITGLTASANMPKLDWVNTWTTTDGYPALINKDYKAPASGVTIYWDGNFASDTTLADNGETGADWDNAIIIDNAQELAYLITKMGVDNTVGKYFKMADGIDKIIMQPQGVLDDSTILGLSSGAEVQNYFENVVGLSNLNDWSKSTAVFDGNFDGNGVEIYGLYCNSAIAGLFATVDGGTKSTGTTAAEVVTDDVGITIKNITVRNSYLKSSNRLGGIVAQTYSNGWGANVQGVVNLDGCGVINSYMENTGHAYNTNYCSVIAADIGSEVVKINNAIVYGNKTLDKNGEATFWLRGRPINSRLDSNGANIYNKITNSIVLGAYPYCNDSLGYRINDAATFSNVYTDMPAGTVTFTNGATVTYTDEQINQINASDLAGNNAADIVDALNAANASTVWYVGALNDMPGFKPAGNVPSLYQSAINSVVFSTPDTVGAGTEYNTAGNMVFGVYQTALSLKANPYMSFAFAFGGDYKTNRDKIKVRFTYTENGALTTSEEISVPAYTGEDIKNVSGWTNTAANGRFHTYKAEGIPVEALAYGIKVEVNYENTGWKDFGTYSVEGLGMQFDSLSKTQPGDYYSTRVEAAKALLFYAQAISARYGAQ